MENTTVEWVDAAVHVMHTSYSIFGKIYPLIFGMYIIKIIAEVI